MIERIIAASLRAGGWVLAISIGLVVVTALAAAHSKLDALPDLSDSQVIIKVEFPGQPPQLVEDQVTYPLTTALMGVAGTATVRAVSMFGEAFVYVVLADQADVNIARERVLERITSLSAQLPQGASVSLGPDASGTGWIYQYALVAQSNTVPIDRLRALQQFFVKPELQSVPGVAEVATFGGSARQLQVEVDPQRLAALGLTLDEIASGVRSANAASGGSAIELGEQRFLLSADARVHSVQDLSDVPVARDATGATVRLGQVAHVSFGPAPSESAGDLNGLGDTVGGVVVMRQGENTRQTIAGVKDKLTHLRAGLPTGVEVVTTYDRSVLIDAAIRSLAERLVEEALVVALVCGVFLYRVRSSLVILISLPIGLLVALAILCWQGVTANIMSLGGLAIAIGAMTDAAIVMVESLHRKLESPANRALPHHALVLASACEVGPALCFSLLVITVSFLPVLSLEGQEGKLFAPLALTKTYAMATAAALSITLVPVLMKLLIRGPVRPEAHNPVNRLFMRGYRPLLEGSLKHPALAIGAAALVLGSLVIPLTHLGSEFMPPLDEGDLLYMPSTLPNLSLDEARRILRMTDRLIRALPQVASVHGKAGRSDSATDPAPLSMLETTIRLKPRSLWPKPISTADLIHELDQQVRLAGLTNSWGFPIRTRIDMLASGVKSPLALRISGPDLARIQALGERAERVLTRVPGVRSAFAERPGEGRFIDVRLDRHRASLFGVSATDVTQLVAAALGGMPADNLTVGRERYPIVIRYPRDERATLEAIRALRVRGSGGSTVDLAQIAAVRVTDGPMELPSENAQPAGYVLLDLNDSDIGGVLERAQAALAHAGVHEPRYTFDWVGQYLRLQQASLRLAAMTVATLLCVLLILFAHFRDWRRVAVVTGSLPFAASGGIWLVWLLGYRWSFAVAVGLLALVGVATEFCVVMILYLDQSLKEHSTSGRTLTARSIHGAVVSGALLRLRPKTMTVAVILGGLAPLMLFDGVGVDVMRRIAAPLLGGMITAPLFSLLVVPALYVLALTGHGASPMRLRWNWAVSSTSPRR